MNDAPHLVWSPDYNWDHTYYLIVYNSSRQVLEKENGRKRIMWQFTLRIFVNDNLPLFVSPAIDVILRSTNQRFLKIVLSSWTLYLVLKILGRYNSPNVSFANVTYMNGFHSVFKITLPAAQLSCSNKARDNSIYIISYDWSCCRKLRLFKCSTISTESYHIL